VIEMKWKKELKEFFVIVLFGMLVNALLIPIFNIPWIRISISVIICVPIVVAVRWYLYKNNAKTIQK